MCYLFYMLRVLYLLIFYISVCHYQWVASNDGNLAGARSIFIEPIISHTPHKLRLQPIWQSINQQFSKEPSIVLSSRKDATHIMRVIIQETKHSPTSPNQTPKINTLNKKANSYSTEENLNLKIQFTVWNKKTQKVEFKKSYRDTTQFKSFIHNSPEPLRYIHYLDNRNHHVHQLAAKITQKVINDYL